MTVTPNLVEQFGAVIHAAGMPCEEQQEIEFLRGEVDILSAYLNLSFASIYREITEAQCFGRL